MVHADDFFRLKDGSRIRIVFTHSSEHERGGDHVEGAFNGIRKMMGIAPESASEVLIQPDEGEEQNIPLGHIQEFEVLESQYDR